jgi:hypothetical protein
MAPRGDHEDHTAIKVTCNRNESTGPAERISQPRHYNKQPVGYVAKVPPPIYQSSAKRASRRPPIVL